MIPSAGVGQCREVLAGLAQSGASLAVSDLIYVSRPRVHKANVH